jgi:hypothetical protein
MVRKKTGKRHPLVMYRHFWNRIWRVSLLLGLLLGVLWWQSGSSNLPIIQTARSLWILAGAIVLIVIGIAAFIARYQNYVQPHRSYIRLVTPLLRLNISYQRVNSVRSADLGKLFPPRQQTWGQRQFLDSFYGMTAVTLELKGYPLSLPLLKLFLPRYLFTPEFNGFVFLVKDWMFLSAELDSWIGSWKERKQQKTRQPGLMGY